MSRKNFAGVLILMMFAAIFTSGMVIHSAVTADDTKGATQDMAWASNGPTMIDPSVTGAGTWRLTVTPGGQVLIDPITVFRPDNPGPVNPTDPPVDELSKKIVAEVEKIPASDGRHGAAIKLSKTLEMLADQTIPTDKIVQATNTIVKLALGGDADAWAGVMGVVNDALGKCTTEAQADAVLNTAAAAVASTIPASAGTLEEAAERYGVDFDKFLEFLMELILKLLPLLIQ